MFVKVSKAGIGMYVVVAAQILKLLGYQFDVPQLTEAIYSILVGIGAVLWIAGQFLRKDLRFGIFRK